MKIHFEPDLDFQADAVDAVCDLFQGLETHQGVFTVPAGPGLLAGQTETGYSNRVPETGILNEVLLENLQAVQLRNGLRPDARLASRDFTVEMETGTGKTYVYLRTALELNRRFGFTKFVVVVPSVATKEGVFKTLEMTREHFRSLYAGVPYDFFVYDSARLSDVRDFATSSAIRIMVMTIQSIVSKSHAVAYKPVEALSDDRPIDLIAGTNPVVIIDEPQSVDGGIDGKGRQAIADLGPLCTLRYSATHVDPHHPVYRLDAVDAYDRELVKQIEVASVLVENAANVPYVRLLSTKATKSTVTAVLELDVERAGTVRRTKVSVTQGALLDQRTDRALYANHTVGEITGGDQPSLEVRFPGGVRFLSVGEEYPSAGGSGEAGETALVRQMIRRTITAHLDKELRLRPLGIKVLSLFFVDRVADYRLYADDGSTENGPYADLFEAEYARAMQVPRYATLFEGVDRSAAAADVHGGYFSIDKNSRPREVEYSARGGGVVKASQEDAARAFELIMRKKEELLSFDTPLKFIFSHSALREGWDNPNVFQICSLRKIRTERQRRQTIGRGLRICVDQDGQRRRGFDINTLTVVADEDYRSFAENLQKEIEKETGIRFGVVESHDFANLPIVAADGTPTLFGLDASAALWAHLREQGYVDASGKVTDALSAALEEGTLSLTPEAEPVRRLVEARLKKIAGDWGPVDADKSITVAVRDDVLLDPAFQALWERIRPTTTYSVAFDPAALVKSCTDALRKAPYVSLPKVTTTTSRLAITEAGVAPTGDIRTDAPEIITDVQTVLPDLLTELQNRTQLTRQTLAVILRNSGKLKDFERNPQHFIEIAGKAINDAKAQVLVDGIAYVPTGDGYDARLFSERELRGYLDRNAFEDKTGRSLYDHVVYDSGTEKDFALELQESRPVTYFTKLPRWFSIPTPLGPYYPDWAVVVDRDGKPQVYLVVETKSSLLVDDLRSRETLKMECGKAHFRDLSEVEMVLEPPARYIPAVNLDGVYEAIDRADV